MHGPGTITGIALALQGKYDEANKTFDKAIELDPKPLLCAVLTKNALDELESSIYNPPLFLPLW